MQHKDVDFRDRCVQRLMLQHCKSAIYPLPVPTTLIRRIASLALLPLLTLAAAPPSLAAAARKHRTTVVTSTRAKKHAKKPLGPRGIADDRATEIQTALIKAGYLNGQPSGHWDAQSQGAMEKFQADNGWQTKLVPDSRALIKLGLGPYNGAASAASSSPLTTAVAHRPCTTAEPNCS